MIFSSMVVFAAYFSNTILVPCICAPHQVDWSKFNPNHQKELESMVKLFGGRGYSIDDYYLAFKDIRQALYTVRPEAKDIFFQQVVFLLQQFDSASELRIDLGQVEKYIRRLNLLGEGETINDMTKTITAEMPPTNVYLTLNIGPVSGKISKSVVLKSLIVGFLNKDLEEKDNPKGTNLKTPEMSRYFFMLAFAPRLMAAYRFAYPHEFKDAVKKVMGAEAVPLTIRTKKVNIVMPTKKATVVVVDPAPKSKNKCSKALNCIAGSSGTLLLGLLASYLMYSSPNVTSSEMLTRTTVDPFFVNPADSNSHFFVLYYFVIAFLCIAIVGGVVFYYYTYCIDDGKDEDGGEGQSGRDGSRLSKKYPVKSTTAGKQKSTPSTKGKSSKVPTPNTTTANTGPSS